MCKVHLVTASCCLGAGWGNREWPSESPHWDQNTLPGAPLQLPPSALPHTLIQWFPAISGQGIICRNHSGLSEGL